MKSTMLFSLLAALTISSTTLAADTPAPKGKVFIVEPANGATVPTTFTVKFGASGVDIVPAGTDKPNSGHHHLLIDTDKLPDFHTPLPATPTLLHFGKAQTETQITLTPGKHSLQLVLGDYIHVPGNNPLISEKITVNVQ
ncbi:hypothetical protein GCM10011613_16410 [Cellvibrio zantedeschiae]|uniref:DUF4399 domain-containing protein n=1 Tax=Cellvibrio zantedeschiae TaxID=1237077 RepID=A0ABQ3AYZ3_9GAMM|nr:DUF4399 domain-containing protein [Cellvibrio zantedeschiae]GGY72173.1 hypothetical protein GCM10011613_16410 [Cellvibrio zantedeschiae]